MTLMVRDEADIVDANLAYHLNAGVDFVIALDHASGDGTSEILESYARSGVLERIVKSGPLREIEWRTALSRMAAVEHGATWVVNADADQFWWPAYGSLRDVLGGVPSSYGIVRSFDRAFVPRPDDGRHFAERMTARLAALAPLNMPSSAYRPLPRILHRGDPRIRISRGSHTVSGTRLRTYPSTYEIEVLHFPWRSAAQMAQKAEAMWRAFAHGTRGPAEYHVAARRAALGEGGADAYYTALTVDDVSLARGLEAGCLTRDTRLRDVLRALAKVPSLQSAEDFEFERSDEVIHHVERSWVDRMALGLEGALNGEAELVRYQRRLDVLDTRLQALEP